jgi:glycosyltransferase involved in cell wall biosynthesis
VATVRDIARLHPGPSLPPTSNEEFLPHVLLVVDQFPRALGGGERIVLKLAALLPAYGYRVSILTFSVHPQTSGLDSPPCPVYLLPLQRTYDLNAFRAGLQLRRFLQHNQVQIVQTFFESSDIWAGFVTRTVANIKLIWSRRDMGILRTQKHHIAYRLMRRMPHAVFAVSDLVRQYCIEVDGIPPARVQTVYNGLNLADWLATEHAASATQPHITTAGNIRPVKGHDVLIRAAAIVLRQFPYARFTIAGDVLEPAYYAELQALIAELNLSQNFIFLGGIVNLRDHLATATIFTLPSRSEGFSNSIIEAMAAALPIVATNVGGNAEAVADGTSGYIVPSEDPTALAEAILRLLTNPALAIQMGKAGKHIVAEKFTNEAMMLRTTRAYTTLLQRP